MAGSKKVMCVTFKKMRFLLFVQQVLQAEKTSGIKILYGNLPCPTGTPEIKEPIRPVVWTPQQFRLFSTRWWCCQGGTLAATAQNNQLKTICPRAKKIVFFHNEISRQTDRQTRLRLKYISELVHTELNSPDYKAANMKIVLPMELFFQTAIKFNFNIQPPAKADSQARATKFLTILLHSKVLLT